MLKLKACFILLCLFVCVGADFENTLTQPIEETLSLDSTHEKAYNANLKGEGHQEALEDSTSHHPQHDRYEAASSESFASVEYPSSSDILNSYASVSEENNITFSHSDAEQASPEAVHVPDAPNYEHIPHEIPTEHIHPEEHLDTAHYAEPQAAFVENVQTTNLEDNIHVHDTDHHPEDHFHMHSHEVASESQYEQEIHHEHVDQHIHSDHEHHDIHEHQHNEHVEPEHMYHEKQHSHQRTEDTHSHHHHGHSHHHKINKDLKMDPKVWVYSILSTLLISIAPIIILLLVPVENTQSHPNILKTLLSFAAGGLLGDAFLHLIPHALVEYMEMLGAGGDAEKVYHLVGFRILGGVVAFLLVEKVIRILKGESRDHGHINHHVIEKWSGGQDDASFGGQTLPMTAAPFDAYVTGDGLRRRVKGNGPLGYESNGHALHHRTAAGGVKKALKTSAYLNLAADFAHNFTDGLAIGASFLAGNSVGFLATCTILLHEVPHEIGDFAILIKSGCSKKKAILLQFLTAVGALSGTICGLAAQEVFSSSTLWILPFTAGGFIYIATVSILPELLENSSLFQSIKEIIALMAGIYLMVLITMFE